MRQNGVAAPLAMLMPGGVIRGGVIRLTANADHLFSFAPLPHHDDWLQGRMIREEWTDLLLSINDAALDSLIHYAHMRLTKELLHEQRRGGAGAGAKHLRRRWLARGVDIVADLGPPVTLDFKVVPIGSTPPNNARGIGDSGGLAATSSGPAAGAGAEGTWASPPPAYPADSAPPGGPSCSAPEVYAFPFVVKPAPSYSAAVSGSSSDEGQSSAAAAAEGQPRPAASASSWRFCPHCAASAESLNAGKAFCPDCEGQWR